MRIILVVAGALLLAGCTTTLTPSPNLGIGLPAIPASISGACAAPSPLPSADTGRQDVERYWATDRTSLAKCRAAHAALVAWYEGLTNGLNGAKRK